MSPPESSGSKRKQVSGAGQSTPEPALAVRPLDLRQAPELDPEGLLSPAATLGADITITRRSAGENAHRHEMEKLKELHRQQLERWGWVAGLVLILILEAGGFWVAIKGADPEIRKTALNVASSGFIAFLSFLAGRGSQSGGKSGEA